MAETENELNSLLAELSDINADDSSSDSDSSSDGPPPPPPPRDSLVFDSPLEEASRTSQRVSVTGGKITFDDRGNDKFDDRGNDRFADDAELDFEAVQEMPKEIDIACRTCRKEIEGDALQALGGLYHFNCLNCSGCATKIGTEEFFDRDNKGYCVVCYKKSFLPKCTRCLRSIEGRYLKALEQDFHEACFNCVRCHVAFVDGKFYESDGNPYCLKDYNQLFGYSCASCHGTISDGSAISALGKYWHREHFKCKTCSVGFKDGKFFEIDGFPYCQEHYHAARGTVCGKCAKPIDGMCVSALGKKWHQGCFTCFGCNGVLSGQVMSDQDKVYCGPCAKAL